MEKKLDLTKPVQTREGIPVRILCTDGSNSLYPVVGLMEEAAFPQIWGADGRYSTTGTSPHDLVNAPPPVRVYERFCMLVRYGDGQVQHLSYPTEKMRDNNWDNTTGTPIKKFSIREEYTDEI